MDVRNSFIRSLSISKYFTRSRWLRINEVQLYAYYWKPLVAWFVTIPFYFLWHQYFTLLCQIICAKLLQKSYLKMNEVFTSHFCFLLWSWQEFLRMWQKLLNGQYTCIHYLWWTSSIKPRLLFSHASYASLELFLRLSVILS